MGLKWWLTFIAQSLLKLAILVVWFASIFRFAREYQWTIAILNFLVTLDVILYFRAWDEDRRKRPRFFEWFPLGDGFYMWWKARKRGGTKKWTI